MSYSVFTISVFDKQVKRLAKKYPSIKKDLNLLINSLQQSPLQGKSLGNNFYKIRFSITSKGRGKSGGARIITFIKFTKNTVFLTSIYDKNEKSTITQSELDAIFKLIP